MKKHVELELVPRALLEKGGKQVLELGVSFKSADVQALSVVYAVDIEDDAGQVFVPPDTSRPALSLTRGSESPTVDVVPEGLPDGYYIVRLRAAWERNKVKEASTNKLYLEVVDGQISIISGDEFLERSALVLTGHSLDEAVQ